MNAKSPVPPTAAPSLSPVGSLKDSLGGFARALGGRAVDKVAEKAGGVTQRLTSYAERKPSEPTEEGPSPAAAAAGKGAETMVDKGSPIKAGLAAAATGIKETFTGLKDKVKNVFGGGGGGGGKGKRFKFNNIVEAIDVGAPVDVVYDAWTEYDRWPDFMKKVENAELNPDEGKVSFKGQVFWSHRQWDTTIVDQEPGRRIVWESTGPKGHLSGVVTFHSLDEELTRIVLAVAYHPKGFVEKTGNIWRALNRRLRLELKFFVRYVMTDAVLNPDKLEGYWAEIQDKEVVRTHDEVVEEQSAQAEDEGEEYEGEAEGEEEEEYEEEAEGEEYEEEGEEEEAPEEAPARTR